MLSVNLFCLQFVLAIHTSPNKFSSGSDCVITLLCDVCVDLRFSSIVNSTRVYKAIFLDLFYRKKYRDSRAIETAGFRSTVKARSIQTSLVLEDAIK